MPAKGQHHSEETKRKISEAHKGQRHDPEVVERIRQKLIGRPSAKKGTKASDETRQRLSESHKGQRAWNEGQKETRPEVLAKISAGAKGRTPPMAGKHHTPEAREKMSAAQTGRVAWNKGLKTGPWSEERRAKLQQARALTGSQRLKFSADSHVRLNELQGGRCGICKTEVRLDIDHDHESGAIRGLLCGPCNRGTGFLHDDPALLRAAIAYLANPPARKL